MIVGNGANEGYIDVAFRDRGQHVENVGLECQMIDVGPDARVSKLSDDSRQLRDHQVISAPIRAARRLDSDLADQDRVADRLDTPRQAGIDLKDVLVQHQIGPKILDLGEQDLFGVCVEAGAQSDLAGQRSQQRLEGRGGALQPRRRRRGAGPRPVAAPFRPICHARAPRPTAAMDC